LYRAGAGGYTLLPSGRSRPAEAVNMDQPDEKGKPQAKKSPMDRRVKIGFLIVFLAAAATIVYWTWLGESLGSEWGDDLDKAFAEARSATPPKKLVVFVRSFPDSYEGQEMIRGTLKKPKSRKDLQAFVKVQLRLDADAAWAKKYGVTKAPTMLVLSADGKKFHKQEGRIGEIDFVKVFLKAELKPVGGAP
jgi:hypothetical protein